MAWTNPFESAEFVHVADVKDAGPRIKLLTFRDGFQCYTHTSIEETELIYNEIFVQKEYLNHSPPFGRMQAVVDVGANIGMFTLFSKRENPNLAIYSFEPIKETYDVLIRNIDLHHLDSVSPYNLAIGSLDRSERTLTYYPNMAGNSTANPTYKLNQQKEMIETFGKEKTDWAFVSETRIAQVRTLSAIIKEHRISSIDFLKIDTEGDECLVLDGIEEGHFKIIQHLAIEIHTELLFKDIQKRLSKLGYVLNTDTGL